MSALRLQNIGSEGSLILQAYVYTGREAVSLQGTGSVGVLKIQPYIAEMGHRILSLISPVYFNGDYLLVDYTTSLKRKILGVPDPYGNTLSGKRD